MWGKFHIANRIGDISEVAAAVTFLASKDAAFINATDLKVALEMFVKLAHKDCSVIFQVDGGYGAMSAEGFGESSSFAGTEK